MQAGRSLVRVENPARINRWERPYRRLKRPGDGATEGRREAGGVGVCPAASGSCLPEDCLGAAARWANMVPGTDGNSAVPDAQTLARQPETHSMDSARRVVPCSIPPWPARRNRPSVPPSDLD